MKLAKTLDCNIEEVTSQAFDLVIAASGYEERATFLFENYNVKKDRGIVLSFDTYLESYRRKSNDLFFKSQGFTEVRLSSDSFIELKEHLLRFIGSVSKSLRILVDYSSMSRVWYAYILSFFKNIQYDFDVSIFFIYSNSKYIPPPKIAAYKSYITPLEGFYSILPPIKPTALIIGLGYIERQAFGLAEYFEAEPFVFIGKNGPQDEYYKDVMACNSLLLEKISKSNVFFYSLENFTYSEALLNHLCKDLQVGFRVVIAPCGPKPFTLLSLITSLKIPGLDVWRISASNNGEPQNKVPNGTLSIVQTLFSNQKDNA